MARLRPRLKSVQILESDSTAVPAFRFKNMGARTVEAPSHKGTSLVLKTCRLEFLDSSRSFCVSSLFIAEDCYMKGKRICFKRGSSIGMFRTNANGSVRNVTCYRPEYREALMEIVVMESPEKTLGKLVGLKISEESIE